MDNEHFKKLRNMKQTTKEKDLWERIVEDMRIHEKVGEYGFNNYISQLSLKQDTGTTLLIEYPEDVLITWVEINYSQNIINSAARVLDAARQIEFVSDSSEQSETLSSPSELISEPASNIKPKVRTKRRSSRESQNSGLNADYRFDNFVVGPNCEFAYAAAQTIVNNESRQYNPLFIHGGSGLGKTHLLQAIGNAIIAQNEQKKVLYVTSEDFTNAYIDAMSKKGDAISAFRRKFRRADVLLIDDVQFLARKEKTQEEFFHTFNALFASGKQIVLSADCSASEIRTMDSRLTSRFDQGMAVRISKPSLESRLAILRHKRKQWKSDMVSDEILNFLADNITCSVRRLEGALTRAAIYASFAQRQPNLEEIRVQLRDLLQEDNMRRVSIEDIQNRVAEAFDIKVSEINGRRRTANIAHPRQLAMYISRKCTELSLQDIGAAFGGRDHGTVIHAAKTIERKMEKDSSLRGLVERMSNSFA